MTGACFGATLPVHHLEREGHLRDDDGLYSWTCELSEFPAQSWVQAQVHGTQLPLTPEADRPRERLLARGAASLRTAELVAILIRAGRRGESALQAGEKIAARYNDRLHCLADAGPGELKEIAAAIGDTAHCQIMAGIEDDLLVTRRLEEAGSILGIHVLDHIVVARAGESSIRDYLDMRADRSLES